VLILVLQFILFEKEAFLQEIFVVSERTIWWRRRGDTGSDVLFPIMAGSVPTAK